MQHKTTYSSWASMKNRCDCVRNTRYESYGGRGIHYCSRWARFDAFLADMGERPAGTILDRRNNDKGYCKSNCRWATHKQSSRNTRRTKITYNAALRIKAMQKKCAKGGLRALSRELGARLGIKPETVRDVFKRDIP